MADVRDKLFEAAWAGWKDNHNLVTICDAILADKPLCKEIGDSAVEKPDRYKVGEDSWEAWVQDTTTEARASRFYKSSRSVDSTAIRERAQRDCDFLNAQHEKER